jgi:simple sugar transport system ATP-binding protein
LALTLFGMTRPDSGAILVDGTRVRFRTSHDAIEHGIAYVSEDRLTLGLVLDQPIGANVVVTVLDKLAGPAGAYQPAYPSAAPSRNGEGSVDQGRQPRKTLPGRCRAAISSASCWPSGWRATRGCSSSTVRRSASTSAPRTASTNRPALAADGVAVIMISDEIPEVLYHSHRVLVMRAGRISGDYVPFRLRSRTDGGRQCVSLPHRGVRPLRRSHEFWLLLVV